MRRFIAVLLCFCFAAQGSLAQICERVDSVDMSVLERAFTKGAESYPAPPLEMNDQSGGEYQSALIRAITAYCSTLVKNIYEQAKTQGGVLINAITAPANELQSVIQMMATNPQNKEVYKLENIMNQIVKQCQAFLSLSPGPGRPLQPPLVPTHILSTQVHSIEYLISPYDLFVNYNSTFHEMSTSLYANSAAIILEGWISVRSYYDVFGLQMRNEILNDRVLDVYRQVASQINTESNFIQPNIDPVLWESYRSAADRIEAAWNAYQLYKSQVACIAYS